MIPIIYDGYVTAKIGNKKYTMHNSGTNVLFRLLVNILTGKSLDLNSVPRYFQVSTAAINSDSVVEGLLYNDIHVSSQVELKKSPYTEKEQWTAVFTGTLTPENFVDIESNGRYYLLLLSGYGHALAYIELAKSVVEHLAAHNQALIQWNVCFGNPQEIIRTESPNTETE